MHKPGAIPLRPLGLGDLYDGAFKIIRFNPKATVGSAALVSAVAMFVPVALTVLVAATFDLSTDAFGTPMTEAEVLVELVSALALAVGSLIQGAALLLVTGMVSVVSHAAAVGRTLGIGEAWQQTHGRRWRLIGLTVLVYLAYILLGAAYFLLSFALVALEPGTGVLVLWFMVTIPAMLALMVWSWTRLTYLAVPAMMIERIGVFRAIGRAFRLTGRQFWRTFGIAFLTGIVTGVASYVFTIPTGIAGLAAPELIEGNNGAYVSMVVQALGSVLAAAFITPFAAAVASLQYLDQRMRKEAYDVELLGQAGIPVT